MARIERYTDRNQRPPFAWEGSEKVTVRIDRIVYSGDNDFVIIEGTLLPRPTALTEMGRRIEFGIKAKGCIVGAAVGKSYECISTWKYEISKKAEKWNEWQLAVELGTMSDPDNEESIMDFLEELDHIGPVRSRNLYTAWGKETMTTLDAIVPTHIHYGVGDDIDEIIASLHLSETNQRILRRNGLGAERLLEFLNSFRGNRASSDTYAILRNANAFGQARKNIITHYKGKPMAPRVLADPLDLLDIDDVSFDLAKKIWKLLGVDLKSPQCIGAIVSEALMQESRKGHCYASSTKTLDAAAKLVEMPEIPVLWFEKDYESMPEVQRSVVVDELGNMWSRRIWNSEITVADRISALSVETPKITAAQRAQIPKLVDDILVDTEFPLCADQRIALEGLLTHQFSMLIGSAGCGKTTITSLVIKLAELLGLHDVLLMAPTGAAARRATQATGLHATTIHRGFGIAGDGPPDFDEEHPLSADLIIFDEVSMLDINLARKALSGIRTGTYVIFVGDSKQLAAVGPGAVLRDLMASGVVPVYELTTVHRNSGKILDMAYSTLSKSPFIVMDHNGNSLYEDLTFDPITAGSNTPEHVIAEKIVARVVDAYMDVGDPNKVKAIVSFNGKFGTHPMTAEPGFWDAGVHHLNHAIAQAMVRPTPGETVIHHNHDVFRVGHRCLWLKNTGRDDPLNMVNGQDFDITGIVKEGKTYTIGILTERDDGVPIAKSFTWDDYKGSFGLGYARTTNKAQGAGYDTVIVVVTRGNWISMENAYTAETRAKKRLILIGYPERLWDTRSENPLRRTGLAGRLRKLIRRENAA